jgi:4-oxalocrotonate tautomerase family enzyme
MESQFSDALSLFFLSFRFPNLIQEGGITMPFINIKVLKGALSKEKKEEMISRVTQMVAEIEARPHPKEKIIPHTLCLIEEVDFEGWGEGGNPVTPDMLKAALTGKS